MVQAFGLLFHYLLARLKEVAANVHNAVASLRPCPGAEPDSKQAFAEFTAKKDCRGTASACCSALLGWGEGLILSGTVSEINMVD